MKSFEGYLKQTAGDTYLLLAGGGIKPLSDFLDANSFKTINGQSLIGTGDISISGASDDYVKKTGDTMTGTLYVSGQPGIQTAAGTGNWNYIRMHNGSNFWDFATLSSLNSGALEFRPAGASNIGPYITPNGMFHFNNINNSSWNYDTAAAWIREYHYSGAGSDTWGLAPRLAWHWYGRVAAQIGLASNGWLYEAPSTGTSFYRIVCETGTWGINITGSSGYASSAGSASSASYANSAGSVAWQNVTSTIYDGNEFNTFDNTPSANRHWFNYRGKQGTLIAIDSYHFGNGRYSNTAALYAGSFNSTSDIRNKTVVDIVNLSIEDISRAPIFKFHWKDGYGDSNIHVGTSAQYWKSILPEITNELDNELKTMSVSYDIAALVSVVTLARKVKELETKVENLSKNQ